tara:strand:- start:20778 stop:22130 length:1353 start_codon:yes stop_codon:yes gene_type:complete
MMTKPRPIAPFSAPISARLSLALVCIAGILSGCSSSKVATQRSENPERVSLRDFSNPDLSSQVTNQPSEPTNEAANSSPAAQQTAQQPRPIPSEGITLRNSSAPIGAQTPLLPDPTVQIATDVNLRGDESLELLDAKIGDVNGKPIFTNTFFAPIEDRLIAEAARLPMNQWRQSAGKTIVDRLDGMIADELLRAEALAALTPNQRVGLQAFLSNFRDNLLSENMGSAQLAKRRIQQEQGKTLDETLEQKEIDTLVQLTLIQEVNRRVNVSWRDIKQRYERDIDQYTPPPTATFRVIRAPTGDTGKQAQIQEALDGGTDFLKVAAGPLNNFNTDGDGMHTAVLEESYETTAFFGAADALNEATQKLSTGESVGPIEFGSSVYWVKLMRIEQNSISLYEAQLKIQQELTIERRKIANDEYLGRLMNRASVSSRDEVLMRLLQIAEQRYGPLS